jgi:hypothetical protein
VPENLMVLAQSNRQAKLRTEGRLIFPSAKITVWKIKNILKDVELELNIKIKPNKGSGIKTTWTFIKTTSFDTKVVSRI